MLRRIVFRLLSIGRLLLVALFALSYFRGGALWAPRSQPDSRLRVLSPNTERLTPNAEMTAEILSIGTELLLGQIVDTNAAYLARALAALGIDVYRKETVGDNPARIEETLRLAAERADLILTSGGLGPTQDDLTKECIASVFGEELVLDPPSLAALEKFFSMRLAPMPERNRKQALIY